MKRVPLNINGTKSKQSVSQIAPLLQTPPPPNFTNHTMTDLLRVYEDHAYYVIKTGTGFSLYQWDLADNGKLCNFNLELNDPIDDMCFNNSGLLFLLHGTARKVTVYAATPQSIRLQYTLQSITWSLGTHLSQLPTSTTITNTTLLHTNHIEGPAMNYHIYASHAKVTIGR